jgi:hypothetical protein
MYHLDKLDANGFSACKSPFDDCSRMERYYGKLGDPVLDTFFWVDKRSNFKSNINLIRFSKYENIKCKNLDTFYMARYIAA